MQRLGKFLLANNLRTSFIALLFILLPWPGNAIAAILVALISLQRGPRVGLGVLAWAMLPALAATWKAPNLALSYDVSFAITALSWLFASLLYWQRNWARVLEMVSLLGMIFIFVVMLLPQELVMHWLKLFESLVVNDVSRVMQVDAKQLSAVIEKYVYYLVGSFYMVPAVIAVLYLMVARAWQLSIADPTRPKLEFRTIRMRRRASLLLVVMIAIAAFAHLHWLGSMSVVATIPFVFAGLSLMFCVGSIEGRNKYLRMGVLIVAFIVLLFVAQLALLLLALAGFIDSWINFRKFDLLKGVNS